SCDHAARILMLRKTPAAANRLGLAESTLEKMRLTGRGPRFIRMGRVVRYDDDDLDAYIEAGRRISTSQNTKPGDVTRDRHPMRDREAWTQGFDAGRRGLAACPYQLESSESRAWVFGYAEGMTARLPLSRSRPNASDADGDRR